MRIAIQNFIPVVILLIFSSIFLSRATMDFQNPIEVFETVPKKQIQQELTLLGQISRVQLMPNLPTPYTMRNWSQVAKDYDAFIFDFNKTGTHLPLISWNTLQPNGFNRDSFSIPSYVGRPPADEAINCIAAVISASLVGINKSNQNGYNWAEFCEPWFNVDSGEYLYLNNRRTLTGGSFWYELFPNILFCQLADFYPNTGEFQDEMQIVADRLYDACVAMGGQIDPWVIPNFLHTAFDFSEMEPVNNGRWYEPDAAAAIGWIEYIAYLKWGQTKYLTAAKWCMDYLQKISFNPYYEVLFPYGVTTAARMNAELGLNYDVDKLINWAFEPSNIRPGWGVIAENWGGYDCYGLHGSTTDGGGYAFAMGTFENVGALMPLVRYDDRFAHDIGKYVLNAANAARLFYSNALDALHQDSEDWAFIYDLNASIAYEALRKVRGSISPLATGDIDQDRYLTQNPESITNLGLYGSSHVGIFGGIISPTTEERILQLDCLKTDYFRDAAYPTYLYFNPYDTEKTIEINIGLETKDIYDATIDDYILEDVSGLTNITIPADTAILAVLTPANGTLTIENNQLLIDGVVVDSMLVSYDTESPVTQTDHIADWYTQDPMINLTASDDLCGVARIYYRINDGLIKSTSQDGQPRILTEGKNNKLEYWSVDKAGNEELPHNIITGIQVDESKPVINKLTHQPKGEVLPGLDVKVTVNASDSLSGVENVNLSYSIDNGTTWVTFSMTLSQSNHLYTAIIPGQSSGTYVLYKVEVIDSAGNRVSQLGAEIYYEYQVLPFLIFFSLIGALGIIFFLVRKRK